MSSQRSSRGAAKAKPAARGGRAAGPARPAGGRGVLIQQQQKSDIYTALLGIALGSLVLGSLFLFLHWTRYGLSLKATALPTPAAITFRV